MKILLINKFHYLKGGSEKYYFELAKLLKRNGHELAFFSMYDEKNITTVEKEYFTDNIDMNTMSKIKALRIIYSIKNKKKIKKVLDEFKPDIVHLNNFQRHLSASIIEPIKKRNIPVVYTMHDIQPICPAIQMLDNHNNICEKCMRGKYYWCIINRCNKGSFFKSILGATEGLYYKINKIYSKKIDLIITPTNFYAELLEKDGINKNKIITIHNFIDEKEYNMETTEGEYALYVGRLSREKGIFNLLEAIKRSNGKKLHIAGEGPEKEEISLFIQRNDLEDQIKLLGFLDKKEIMKEIAYSKFVVVPSIWYENGGYSTMEASAIGKTVLASNIGGIPEVILDGNTGILYEHNDIDDLTKKINMLFHRKNLDKEYGMAGKNYIKENFSAEKYYNSIIKVYEKLVKEKK